MSTNARPALRAVPDPVKPRTDTEEKLWQALLDNPGSTASALSATAGIGKSTAPKLLARWEKEGLVARTAGIADGGSRPADRWSITTDDRPSGEDRSADDGPTDDRRAHDHPLVEGDVPAAEDRPAAAGEADVDAEPKGRRLAPGALRGLVEDHLREHSGQDFTPNVIGRALSRSAGAVHNALEKLVGGGYAVRTSDKPKRYALAPGSDESTANS
ncbi:MarR family transcriptional regulator [Saccharothrix sp. NRRL B-16314]|uniref:MarR family transcriptional regulator n=1 Tax=Saccharothrix sp. NRRL B-16314 TaxID=1463825 RepID=UPI0007C46410|nr:helix-turn-helix domain-containing protein [Saccharothrix sp. NRRL B-16314]